MVPVLRLDRLRDLVRVEREGRLVERLDRLALAHGELPALLLRARVLRVLLRQRREVRTVL